METNDPQLAADLEDLEFVRSCVLELLYASLARSPESLDIIAMIEIVQSGRFESADGADSVN